MGNRIRSFRAKFKEIMGNRIRSFRGKFKVKLKILVVRMKQVGQRVSREIIRFLIITKEHGKEVLLYIIFIVGSTTAGANWVKANAGKSPFLIENNTRMERIMGNRKLRFRGQEASSELKDVVSANQKPEILSGKLFGQPRNKKTVTILVASNKNEDVIKPLDSKNDNSRNPKNDNSRDERLLKELENKIADLEKSESDNSEGGRSLMGTIDKALEVCDNVLQFGLRVKTHVTSIWRTLKGYSPIQGVEGFQNQNIPNRQQKPANQLQHPSPLLAKPQTGDQEIFNMLNRPADPKNGKLATRSAITYNNKLTHLMEKLLLNKRYKKDANNLIERFRSGNLSPGSGTEHIKRTNMLQLRTKSGVRILVRKHPDVIEIMALFHKDDQTSAFRELKKLNMMTLEQIKKLTDDA